MKRLKELKSMTDNFKKETNSLEKEIEKMYIPTPSKKKFNFNMMQKLFSYWVKKNHYYGNWSGTGVGKTYSFILASRVIDSHMTVVIGYNSTTGKIANDIKGLYDDSVVEVYDGKLPDFDMAKHNYLIFNYEKGQQEYSNKLFESVLVKYKVDYIVFDEGHLVKQTERDISNRRKILKDFRDKSVVLYDSYVTVMTATPFINNLKEVISILSLLTGEDYKDVKTENKMKNTIDIQNLLNSHGVLSTTKPRNIYGKEIEEKVQIDEIIGDDDTFESFRKSLDDKSPLSIYQSTLSNKLKYIIDNDRVKRGELTIIYTLFTKGIVNKTKKFLTDKGFRVCEYTGTNTDTKPYTDKYGEVDWKKVKKNYDVLLSSKPISTGVDGLQKVCNNMVILTLPWTDSDYIQLKGRIYRKNSIFDKVNIWIPMVRFPQIHNVGYDDKVWNSIQTKKIYSNACLNGEFPLKSDHKSISMNLKNLIKEYCVNAA